MSIALPPTPPRLKRGLNPPVQRKCLAAHRSKLVSYIFFSDSFTLTYTCSGIVSGELNEN